MSGMNIRIAYGYTMYCVYIYTHIGQPSIYLNDMNIHVSVSNINAHCHTERHV